MIPLIDKTFIKFVLVGIINTLFGTAVMFIAYNVFHAGYWLSSMLNYILGSILSYFLNNYFTFQYGKSDIKSIIKFTLNISLCYFVAYFIAKRIALFALSSMSVEIRENIAMLIGMCLFVILNYCGQRFFAFKK